MNRKEEVRQSKRVAKQSYKLSLKDANFVSNQVAKQRATLQINNDKSLGANMFVLEQEFDNLGCRV